ncbi:unnamed protein product [Phytophthora fragariaefolia]|uniref:Unnamed protein product n=1 Tax=Phytophthora fragariaefolia TaxID=1490495 RepID=A0A9W7CYR7_9STRA|nr:unnamed protein product [Phytophthora fragariaefolia]
MAFLEQLPGTEDPEYTEWWTYVKLHKVRLGHILQWEVKEAGVVTFKDVTKGAIDLPRSLITVVIGNFPDLLYRKSEDSELGFTATPSNHPLTACIRDREYDGTTVITIKTSTTEPENITAVSSELEVLLALKEIAGDEVTITKVHPHTQLSRRVSLWDGRRRRQTRRGYKQAARAAVRRRGLQEIARRQADWHSESSTIGRALDSVSWASLRRQVGVSVWGNNYFSG